jgi:hypothetical protein
MNMSYSRTQNLSVSFEDDGTWELLDDNGNDCVGFITRGRNDMYAPHWEEEEIGDCLEFPTLSGALTCLIGKALYEAPKTERLNWNPPPPRMLTPGA